MDNLFYSHDENVLFWVAGYAADLNTSKVDEKITSLVENQSRFAEVAKCPRSEVHTTEILESSRYKYMRVFYVETPYVPKEAFVIGEGEHKWTMWQWLKN